MTRAQAEGTEVQSRSTMPTKIDIFPHILPRKYFDRMLQVAPPGLALRKRMSGIPVLIDVEARLRIMDRYDNYVQVLTLANPPIEVVGGPDVSPDLARLANDGMAEVVGRHPDRFPGFVASLPMNNPDAALNEIDRALDQLGATGVQVYTNVAGQALDRPEFRPIFDAMARRRLPIWMHPARPPSFADYAGEPRSKFDMWWAFGWPYETSVAMGRLVFDGLFDRHPDLAIITHHMGAMIPFCAGRVGGGLDQLGSRTDDPEDMAALGRLRKRPIDYFKMFYGDTALFGAWPAMQSGLEFFGADHVLFGTDMPFDSEKGHGFIRDTIAAMDRIRATDDERRMIYEGNARRMLKLALR
jgi:predicted TIM-barrel fold metal-dependent hydrolase